MADERLARQREAELGVVSVNNFTRSSMRLPSARLEAYRDIRPSLEVQLHSRQHRLEEITTQASYETRGRFVSVNPQLYSLAR